MIDLLTFLQQMEEDGTLDALVGNPLAQFGPPQAPYLGATLLPERNVESNAYEESQINYRTVIANDGSRYSPAQLKSAGQIVGSFAVWLGNQDIAVQMGPRDYEAISKAVQRNVDAEAAATLIQWFDRSIVQALTMLEEKQRWEAIVGAEVVRLGDNAYTETVAYPDPAGHRAAAALAWSTNTTDPFDDIYTMVDLLKDKGYTVNRIITRSAVVSIMARNEQVIRRIAPVRVLSDGNVFGRLTAGDINAYMNSDNLPAIEVYDATYRDLAGNANFIPDGAMVLICTTGRDETVAYEDTSMYLPNTLGYTAIGVPVGRTGPGRAYYTRSMEDKPPRIEAEGWQTSLPVITEPESIAVITGIA